MARILELEDDIHTISDKVLMKEVELDRYGHLPEAFTLSLFFSPSRSHTGNSS